MRTLILKFIDLFYPLFRRFMPLQTFRYAACGGFNTVLDILIFFISYNFIFRKQVVHFGAIAISPHIAAFLAAFCVTFPTGFYLSRYVVFTESNIRGRIQLFRYFLLVLGCIALNYMFLKLFVEQMHIYPTVSKILTTVVVVCFSYFTQKHFTFKTRAEENTKSIKIHLPD
jgi:putative flippase GtrA